MHPVGMRTLMALVLVSLAACDGARPLPEPGAADEATPPVGLTICGPRAGGYRETFTLQLGTCVARPDTEGPDCSSTTVPVTEPGSPCLLSTHTTCPGLIASHERVKWADDGQSATGTLYVQTPTCWAAYVTTYAR